MLLKERAGKPIRAHLDARSLTMLIIIIGVLIWIAIQPSKWLWLALPVLVILDGLRVELSDYVGPHTERELYAKRELIIGVSVLIFLVCLFAYQQFA